MRSTAESIPVLDQALEKERRGGFLVAQSTEALSHHESGEDSTVSLVEQGIIGLSEGSGTSSADVLVGRKAAELLKKYGREIKGKTVSDVSSRMDAVIDHIAEITHTLSGQNTPSGERVGSASFIAAKVLETPQGNIAIIKSIGTSRALIWRASGRVDILGAEQGLLEDNELQAKVSSGEITQGEHDAIRFSSTTAKFVEQLARRGIANVDEMKDILGLTKEAFADAKRFLKSSTYATSEKSKHRLRLFELVELFRQNLDLRTKKTRAIGSHDWDKIQIHTAEELIRPGDRLILTSGAVEDLLPSEISDILNSGQSLQSGLDSLRQAASERLHDPLNPWRREDNVTLIGIEAPSAERRSVDKLTTGGEVGSRQRTPSAAIEKIHEIDEATARALGLAEAIRDPEVAALEKEIENEKALLAALEGSEGSDWLTRTQAFLNMGRMIKGGASVRENWAKHITSLKKELALLKVRKGIK